MYSNNDFLSEVAALPLHPRIREVATTLHFDEHYEMLWAGTKSGGLYVYECPSLTSYAWFRGHTRKVEAIRNVRGGCVSISSNMIRVHNQGGRPKLTQQDAEGDIMSMMIDPSDGGLRESKLLLGRGSGVVSIYDLRTSQYLNRGALMEGSIGVMEPVAPGFVACGTSSGRILLVDPRTGLKVRHQIMGHKGGIVDMATKQNLLVSCGYDMPNGSPVVDTYIKVYDARSLRQNISSVLFPAGPSYLAFHPKFSSTLVVASTSDIISLQEIQSDSPPQTFKVNTDGSGLLSFAISSSGDFIAIGGGRGVLRLEAASKHAAVNLMSAPHSRPHCNPSASVSLREGEPFHMVAQHPSITGRLLSDWDPAMIIDVGRPPRIVDESILRNLKRAEFIGHLPNPEYRDSLEKGLATKRIWGLRNARVERNAEAMQAIQVEGLGPTAANNETQSGVPVVYRFVEIKRPGTKRFEEFNFGLYNFSKFAGLENGITNSYCNSLLQVLYFQPEMRRALLERQPDASQEINLLDEMGFLFRMLADAPSTPCQASNLLRALHHVQEAGALGLLDGDSARKEMSQAEKISSLYKFMIERLHREWRNCNSNKGGAGSPSENIFGVKTRIHTKCLNGEKSERTQTMTSFLVELSCVEELEGELPGILSFADMLQASLQSDCVLQAWFDESHGDQQVRQTKVPAELPQVLVANCCCSDGTVIPVCRKGTEPASGRAEGHWIPSMFAVRQVGDRGEVAVTEGETLEALGLTEEELADLEEPDSRDSCGLGNKLTSVGVYELTGVIAQVQAPQSFDGRGHLVAHVKVLPPYMQRNQGVQGLVEEIPAPTTVPFAETSGVNSSRAMAGGESVSTTKDVRALSQTDSDDSVSNQAALLPDTLDDVLGILDADRGTAGSAAGQDSGASGESSSPDSPKSSCGSGLAPSGLSDSEKQWLLINDFSLSFTTADEVRKLYGGRKMPCLLFYTKRSSLEKLHNPSPLELVPVLDHWEFSELCRSRPLQGLNARSAFGAFKPLEFDVEVPKPGMLFGLDAEFVVQGPLSGVGLASFKKEATARMILGRVSVVRGEGPMAGVCCIDDYVRPLESVQDYLTRFSGLVEADLDVNTSQHYLTTLKHVYVKLRYLVDCGCVFVGHGLKKDFRIINIVVPQNQIIDTVELFHLKRHRMFSLRFLASYLLGLDIQSNTHDSIEDARTALQIYEVYHRLVKEGVLEQRLKEMYKWGNQHGWDPGHWNIRPGESGSGSEP
ncbi:hypothetical protein BSKO_04899 [Bryopsis sp. KO-2023]|nr:hypothetical protein BSKO_04899 [Bryopsis sp. KO-2023]